MPHLQSPPWIQGYLNPPGIRPMDFELVARAESVSNHVIPRFLAGDGITRRLVRDTRQVERLGRGTKRPIHPQRPPQTIRPWSWAGFRQPLLIHFVRFVRIDEDVAVLILGSS